MADDRTVPERAVDTIDLETPAFRAARRGYDPAEVDAHLYDLTRELADRQAEVAHLHEREQALAAALAAAREELQAVRARDAAMMAQPGSEAERIIESARTAALEIRTRAQLEANDIVKAANDEVRAVRADAEQLVVRRSREADEAAAVRVQEANEAVHHAHERAEALRIQTEQRAAASLEAARTRARSLVGEAEAVRAQAAEEAAAAIAEAEARGHELIDEAQQVRERIINELGPRRHKLRSQVEQLQAGRDRLLMAYQVVRTALDEATVELEVALPEARDAAVAAATRTEAEPDEQLDRALQRLRAGEPHDRDELAALHDGGRSGVRRPGGPDEDTAEYDVIGNELPVGTGPAGYDEGDTGSPVADDEQWDGDPDGYADDLAPVDGRFAAPGQLEGGPGEAADALGAEEASEDADGTDPDEVIAERPGLLGTDDGYDEPVRRRVALAPDPVEGRWSSAVRIIASPGRPERDEPAPVDDATSVDAEDAPVADPPDPPDSPGAHHDDEPAGAVGAGSARSASAEDAGGGPQSDIDELVFAEALGGDRATPSGPPADAEPARPASLVSGLFDGSGGMPRPEAAASEPADDLDPVEALKARRDEAVAGPRRALRRRLKGTLVEEENALLDAIRQVPSGVPKAHEVLPTEQDHLDRLTAAAAPGLLAAWVAGQDLGVRLATDETRRRVPGALPDQLLTPAQVDTQTVDAIARRLAADLATELRARVASCFPVGPPPSPDPRAERRSRDELATAVRSAYRGVKAGLVEPLSDRAVLEATHRALRAQLPAGVQPAGVDLQTTFPVGRRRERS